jgi:hypothetical protein
MGKRDDIIAKMIEEAKKLNLTLEDEFISKVTKGLGPVIYNKDTATVACGQADELETVKKNFLKKKLGLTNDDAELDAAIKEVCVTLGTSNRAKYRVHFYALLAIKFNKTDIYDA